MGRVDYLRLYMIQSVGFMLSYRPRFPSLKRVGSCESSNRTLPSISLSLSSCLKCTYVKVFSQSWLVPVLAALLIRQHAATSAWYSRIGLSRAWDVEAGLLSRRLAVHNEIHSVSPFSSVALKQQQSRTCRSAWSQSETMLCC